MTKLSYVINDFYRYPKDHTFFKLIKVDGYKFIFDKNHWCTDCVFCDLIHVKSNTQVYKIPIQLELIF